MAKGNPFKNRTRSAVQLDRELVSYDNGEKYDFVVRRLGKSEKLAIQDRAWELIGKYVDGGQLLPPVGDQAVIPSRGACFVVATFLVAQNGAEGTKYNEHELFAMMTDETAGHEPVANAAGAEWKRLPSLVEQMDELCDQITDGPEEKPSGDPLDALQSLTSS